MSLALIEESAKEVRRLAIAGSPLAVGDFRLKKLVAPLEQAGAKVPVFGQVAKAINDLVSSPEAEASARLLNLSTLLNAIRYTQGQSGAPGEYRELEVFPVHCTTTRTPARLLKPLIEALTASGGGRFEVVKTAVERGAFNDLRLIDPAIQALGDSYGELADLVAEKILPAYGPGIVPQLKARLDLKGKTHDARKLAVLHQVDPSGALELCKTALEDGSVEVKVVAIACLGKHEECLPLVLEQANAKNKPIRAAALAALAEHDRPEITRLFTELVNGKALDILAAPFRALRNPQVLNALLEEGKRVFELTFKGDEEQISRCLEILACLKGRKDAEVETFLLAGFAQSYQLSRLKAPKKSPLVSYSTGADLLDRMAWLLYEIGSPAALAAVLAQRDRLPPASFHQVLQSALRLWSPEQVYQEFAPLLGQVKGVGKEKMAVLQQTIQATCGGLVSDADNVPGSAGQGELQNPAKIPWDARWLDAAIEADSPVVVCCLARPNHQATITYLTNLLAATAKKTGGATVRTFGQSGLIIKALAHCQYPKLTGSFLEAIRGRMKGAQHVDYDLQMLLASAKYLPPSDLPQLDAFAAKLDEKFVDSFLEALAPLRIASQPNPVP